MIRLLVRHGAVLNPPTVYGLDGPLYWAVSMENEEALETLLELGANPDGSAACVTTPLAEAAQRGNDRMIRILLERGADPRRACPNSPAGRKPGDR